MRITNKNIFWIYLSFFFLLSLWFHKDVLFNLYNYGRHWDWTFYPISGLYKHYIEDFFTAIKPNSLGYVDILSVSIGEFTTKFVIYILSQLSMRLLQTPVSVPVLNKIVVFILLPLVSTLGMWHLCKRTLHEIYHTDKRFFLIVAAFANIVYTFSLVLIFDLHGGALNRQLSSAIFPWFFLVLYDYYESTAHKYIDYHVILMGLLFIVFDISNIFFAGVLIVIATFLKRIPWKFKMSHILVLGIFVIGVNAFWLQGLFIGNSIDKTEILKERKLDYNILANYSVPYRDILTMLNTPHNLANATFSHNILKYVPFVSVYVIMCLLLINNQIFKRRKRLALFILISYLFTTILATGVFSIGRIYTVLYSISILGFIRSSVRYMPNLAVFTVLVLIIVLKIATLKKESISGKYHTLFFIPLALWTLFLVMNGHIIFLVMTNVVKNGDTNHEIGALYRYDTKVFQKTDQDALLYNIIPVPSWFSPVFIDNVYPKTSQGSDTDNAYLSKGSIMTYGLPTFSSEFLEMFINAKVKPFFFAITNTRNIWFKNQKTVPQLTEDLYFNKNWAFATLGDSEEMKRAYREHDLFTIDDNYFLPRVYSPDTVIKTSKPLLYMPALIDMYGDHMRTSFVFSGQNNATSTADDKIVRYQNAPTLEFKQITPSKYRVRIHGGADTVPLILSTPYNLYWSAYLIPHTQKIDKNLLYKYKTLQGNEKTQASPDTLNAYIQNGWISTLGDGNIKEKIYVGYKDDMEYVDSREQYTIGYISKVYYGTIQNNNLPDGGLFEPWTDAPAKVDSKYHITVNGFANGWNIPLAQLCSASRYCTKTAKGYDAEFVIVYDPQKNYQIGLLVSAGFIMFAVIYCGYVLIPRNKQA